MRFVCWLALPVGLFIGGINAANAEVSDEVRQACTPDAMRLCSEFIPDAAKVRLCMIRKHRELSETCRAAMAGGAKAGRVSHKRRKYARHHRYRRHHK